ncbi:MAG TPA: DUF177 domain-containing protein [Candidatus Kapabacteria bacterium]|nr:DUF177 domain-containing protein [Candidatus Kapabacteria bacterium]
MQSGTFVIPVQHLSEGDNSFTFPQSETLLKETDIAGKVGVHATIRKLDNRFLLHCDITVTYHRECDRCLDEFEGTFRTFYEQWYAIDRPEPAYAEEDAYVISRETRFIVIDEDVRESVLVGEPTKFLCSEACKGLCPVCGKNRNREQCDCSDSEADAAWAELAKFTKNE